MLYKILARVKEIIPGYYAFVKEDHLLDDDVQLEQERVNYDAENDVLKVFGLQKKFRRCLNYIRLFDSAMVFV